MLRDVRFGLKPHELDDQRKQSKSNATYRISFEQYRPFKVGCKIADAKTTGKGEFSLQIQQLTKRPTALLPLVVK